MNIQVTNTNFSYDEDYNITSVRVFYNVRTETGKLNERANGDMQLTGEEFQGNEAVPRLVELIKEERRKVGSPEEPLGE